MDAESIADLILKNSPAVVEYILVALGGLVVIGYTYIKATPTENDDQWLQKLESNKLVGFVLRMFVRFSPVARKADLEKFDDEEAKAKKEEEAKNV
jgi:hypothetical protein